jgi:hypothetical protein
MAETPKELEEAVARAKKDVADEVQTHKPEDKDLEEVVGGSTEALWKIGVIYDTSAS